MTCTRGAPALRQLKRLLKEALTGYPMDRDRPGVAGTSRLSPHLHFGEISPGQVWRAVLPGKGHAKAGQSYLRQLGWREFAYHLLYHHAESPHTLLRREFSNSPWQSDPRQFQAWKRGRTGSPWWTPACVNCGKPVGCITG